MLERLRPCAAPRQCFAGADFSLWDVSEFVSHEKKNISLKTVFGYSATPRTSFLSWFQDCQIRPLDLTHQLRGHFQDRGVITQHLLPARLRHLQ